MSVLHQKYIEKSHTIPTDIFSDDFEGNKLNINPLKSTISIEKTCKTKNNLIIYHLDAEVHNNINAKQRLSQDSDEIVLIQGIIDSNELEKNIYAETLKNVKSKNVENLSLSSLRSRNTELSRLLLTVFTVINSDCSHKGRLVDIINTSGKVINVHSIMKANSNFKHCVYNALDNILDILKISDLEELVRSSIVEKVLVTGCVLYDANGIEVNLDENMGCNILWRVQSNYHKLDANLHSFKKFILIPLIKKMIVDTKERVLMIKNKLNEINNIENQRKSEQKKIAQLKNSKNSLVNPDKQQISNNSNLKEVLVTNINTLKAQSLQACIDVVEIIKVVEETEKKIVELWIKDTFDSLSKVINHQKNCYYVVEHKNKDRILPNYHLNGFLYLLSSDTYCKNISSNFSDVGSDYFPKDVNDIICPDFFSSEEPCVGCNNIHGYSHPCIDRQLLCFSRGKNNNYICGDDCPFGHIRVVSFSNLTCHFITSFNNYFK